MLVRITDTRTDTRSALGRGQFQSRRRMVARGWAEPAQPLVREMLKPGPSGALPSGRRGVGCLSPAESCGRLIRPARLARRMRARCRDGHSGPRAVNAPASRSPMPAVYAR